MSIKPLAKTPLVGSDIDNTTFKQIQEIITTVNQLVGNVDTATATVPAHKATHATGGTDVLTLTDIGAAAATHSHDENVGEVKAFARKTTPNKFLKCNGQTIGNASSGATARANADTQTLFEMLWADWDNTVLPIQTSSGTAATRGASATADFNANKRLPLPDLRDEYLRGWVNDRTGTPNAGRVFGSWQGDDIKSHTHVVSNGTTTLGFNPGSSGVQIGRAHV